MSDDAYSSAQTSRWSSALSEADYAKMHDALKETARGRWFLDEYARRNRNADTRMVLDAVARIESVVAAQQAPPAAATAALADQIGRSVQLARAEMDAAPSGAPEDTLTPARRAARIIREIAWQMRACGNDPRICNILDAQLDAIDARMSSPDSDPDARLRAVLDVLIADVLSATESTAPGSVPQDASAEDDEVLARIAAEMATQDDAPDADSFDEARPRAVIPVDRERRKDSLGEMLIARGIIPAPGDRDAPASGQQIN